MATLKEKQLAEEYTRPVERLTSPFAPVRRLVAAATDVLRRKENPFIVGGLDTEKLSPTITDKKGKEATNPNFSASECFKITRPTAEIIVLLTCEESILIDCMGDIGILDREVNKILLNQTDTDIIQQVPVVFEAIEGIGNSSVEVESEESDSLDPGKKTSPVPIG